MPVHRRTILCLLLTTAAIDAGDGRRAAAANAATHDVVVWRANDAIVRLMVENPESCTVIR